MTMDTTCFIGKRVLVVDDEAYIRSILRLMLERSGYEVSDIPHACCGGGIGYMHRLDVIDAIAANRIQEFLKSNSDYYTTYCVSCWWILYRFSKMNKVKRKPRSLLNLLK